MTKSEMEETIEKSDSKLNKERVNLPIKEELNLKIRERRNNEEIKD